MGEYAGDIDEYDDHDGYDDYEDDEERQEEEDEEEYEEEERKPTAEELEYLELRARLKEQIRKKMQRESSSSGSKSLDKKKKISSDNYGSFFGPSQPVIANRVIQESKSLLENQHLALKMLNSQQGNKKRTSSALTASGNGVRGQLHKVNEQKVKIQKLKDTRDYSFLLSDDADLPAPTKKPGPQSVSTSNSEARSAPLQQKNKLLSSSNGGNSRGGREEKKSVSVNGNLNSKISSYKSTSVSKSNPETMNSKRQLGSNGGTGPGRPSGQKHIISKAVGTMVKKPPVLGPRSILPAAQKPPSTKILPSMSKQAPEQKRGMQIPSKAKVMPKHLPISSKPQTSKPVKHLSLHSSFQESRPKKKPAREVPDDDDEMALSMIRRMFNTQRFQGRPDDDSDMEANFDDILREEKRSAMIARKEDEEQLRLIEEEERRERMKKVKKRKLSQR